MHFFDSSYIKNRRNPESVVRGFFAFWVTAVVILCMLVTLKIADGVYLYVQAQSSSMDLVSESSKQFVTRSGLEELVQRYQERAEKYTTTSKQ
jgi:hypothetical protein